jgi:hypothetical protein
MVYCDLSGYVDPLEGPSEMEVRRFDLRVCNDVQKLMSGTTAAKTNHLAIMLLTNKFVVCRSASKGRKLFWKKKSPLSRDGRGHSKRRWWQ